MDRPPFSILECSVFRVNPNEFETQNLDLELKCLNPGIQKPQPFLILLNVFSKSKFVFITNFYRIKLEYPKF
ncbi:MULTISPECIES: hypothetical protein [Leptospira]|uniref:Uncharacterized protein n=2 Tax=Leptospira interrogans TaxID=173 RepID=A0AAQ1SPY0_LEPIR|nr:MULTISPECIES: hypothetical protein [Leptospira]EJP04958.1 hypothetical protein LEP1GSC007_2831 [Leptospira interrogans serovar Bulgarica str. Mallika]EKO07962.1 hypothetical protein LEP1GSC077_1826 [Leptospira interrogans str. C10069]EMJ52693.1 hypothetical protein LEP1GSC013_3677 [Leptospira interrogans serovar Valbuzzi str. Duyster]EMN30496.1 hypothetical protein LEP1GSC083_0418 [Leptospira interrogans serovar Pyrogenes str. L0374]EMN63854.1 hypothetical protein LEP1GSC092_0504 [Leptospir